MNDILYSFTATMTNDRPISNDNPHTPAGRPVGTHVAICQ